MVLAFTLPAARPWEEPWPWVSAAPWEWRKARRYLEAGVAEAVFLDVGAYRLLVREGRSGYPPGFLGRYAGLIREAAGLARRAGARLLFAAPDLPYRGLESLRLSLDWLGGFGVPEGAEPVIVVQPPCRGSRCWHLYPRVAPEYRDALAEWGAVAALVQVDRARPRASARGVVAASAALGWSRVHLLGATLRLLESISGVGCVAGLESMDTSSWYWERHYRGVEAPLRSYMLRVLEAARALACRRRGQSLEEWLGV